MKKLGIMAVAFLFAALSTSQMNAQNDTYKSTISVNAVLV